MDTDLERYDRYAASGQSGVCNSGQLGFAALHLSERACSNGPDWTALPEGVFLYISRFLDPHTISNARAVCRPWRRAFSLNVHTARLEIREHRAAQARTFMRAFVRAFPYTTKLVLDITFRRTAREKIQTALEEHFLALQDFGLQVLQLNLDLNSFNERKIKLLDVSLLASWGHLTRLVLQESGWRSQQLRVDANTVFSSLPALQELSVVCKYSGHVKAKWWRPPPPSNHQHKVPTALGKERRGAAAAAAAAGTRRIPTWPPAAAAAPSRNHGGGAVSGSTSTSSIGINGGGSGGAAGSGMLLSGPMGAAGGPPLADPHPSNETAAAGVAGGSRELGCLPCDRRPERWPLEQWPPGFAAVLVSGGDGGDAAMDGVAAAAAATNSVAPVTQPPPPSAPGACQFQSLGGIGGNQPMMVGHAADATAASVAVAAASAALHEGDGVGVGGGLLAPSTMAPMGFGAGAVVAPLPVAVRPLVTQHLRCQLTQNQSMSGELQKALKRITPALQQHVSALTFEIVEETYPEPSRCATPLELSALPGLKSLTVLSGAEDALSHSKLDLVGATGLETLVLFDVSCGCWCYKKPGHGIPPRLLSAPPAYLRSLTVVGFVVDQCQNLHALSLLTSLEELRLEQPDPDCLAAVAGELLLTWLPSNLRSLKLHSVVLPPCGVPSSSVAAAEAAMAGGAAGPAAAGLPTGWFGGAGCGMDTAATAGGECSSSSNSNNASQLLYGVAPVAPLPQLRELYLSKCKVPTLGLLGVCSQLTALGVINCLSSSGMMPAAAAMPALRSLAVIYTLPPEQEYGSGGVVLSGMMPPPAFAAAAAAAVAGPFGAAAPAASTAAARGGGGGAAAAVPITVASTAAADFGGGGGSILAWSGATAAATTAMPAAMPQQQQHVPGLLLPPVVWGSDEQVAAVAGCRTVTSLELILPRGTAGAAAVASLASLTDLLELDVALPCGLSCCMMGLARLGRSSGGRLRRLTLWVDGRTCVNRENARQLQALQRSLQTRMPDTAVEWAGAESRQGSWTRLEARVFNPH